MPSNLPVSKKKHTTHPDLFCKYSQVLELPVGGFHKVDTVVFPGCLLLENLLCRQIHPNFP